MTTIPYKSSVGDVSSRPFDPLFLDQFASAANSVFRSNANREFTVGATSANRLFQSYTLSAVPSADTSSPAEYTGSLTSTYTGPEYNLESVYNTDRTLGDYISVSANKLAPGVQLKATAYSRSPQYGYDSYTGALETIYRMNQVAVRSRFFSDSKKHTLEAYASAGRYINATDSVTAGATVRASYSNSNTNLESEDFGINYTTKGLGVTVKTNANMSQVSTVVTHHPSEGTTLGAKLDAPLTSLKELPGFPRNLTLGVMTHINEYLVRGSANLGDGSLIASFERKLPGYRVPATVGVTLQSSLNKSNLNSVNALDKVGVQFNFGDNN